MFVVMGQCLSAPYLLRSMYMTNLITYTLSKVLSALVSEYFVYALGVTLIIGVIELFFLILGIRRKGKVFKT